MAYRNQRRPAAQRFRSISPDEERQRAEEARQRDVQLRQNPAAIFRRADLATQQSSTERLVAFFLLFLSFIGIMLFGSGGLGAWAALVGAIGAALAGQQVNWAAATPLIVGTLSAAAVQVLCTRIQWIYANLRWYSPWWLIAFVISTGGTLLGFWPLVHQPVTAALQWAQVPADTAPWLAGAILCLAAGLLDFLPEQILTD